MLLCGFHYVQGSRANRALSERGEEVSLIGHTAASYHLPSPATEEKRNAGSLVKKQIVNNSLHLFMCSTNISSCHYGPFTKKEKTNLMGEKKYDKWINQQKNCPTNRSNKALLLSPWVSKKEIPVIY